MNQKTSLLNTSTILGLLKNRTPKQLVIQYTDHCNALCPQCGMRVSNPYMRSTLNLDYVKGIIRSAAEKGVQILSFTGGEPLLYFDDILELSNYAASQGIPYSRTGTNGFSFLHSEKPDFVDNIHKIAEKTARSSLRNIWISIDSADPQTHEKMRGLPNVIAGIEKALPIFHQYGIYPAANLGINRNITGDTIGKMKDVDTFYEHFYHGFKKYYQFIIDLGFTITNTCYPMSLDQSSPKKLNAAYQATSTDFIVKFTPNEKIQLFKALMAVIPLYRSKIRIFTPRVSLLSLIRQYKGNPEKSYPCLGGSDYFFISAFDGMTYPCGYRGSENLGDFRSLDISKPDRMSCRLCDWECYRDPSEFTGNILDLLHHPIHLVQKYYHDDEYFKTLVSDLKYYNACEFFNSRKPLNINKLKNF